MTSGPLLRIALVVGLSGCGGQPAVPGASDGPPTGEPAGDIIELIESDGRFGTFLELLRIDTPFCCTGLVRPLREATLTLFAPTDEAFATLPRGVLQALIEDEEPMLRLLENHIIHGDVPTNAMTSGDLETVGGMVEVTVDGEDVTIGTASIVEADIPASNGRIHVIDGVITRSCLRLSLQGEPECRDLAREAA
jgi:uncharacterized surface protein with fasciclin (FAS1) repeats